MEELRARIDAGTYKERYPIPSIKRLAEEFGVAEGTVRKVLALLTQENRIRPISGKGTFVRRREEWADNAP
ncbi:GntR family transcriptional regulator [Microbispora siamensis]|uniref:GntR family transcriptional regulator n=1 Tax=Microbispora siamensis TaxID=564413 RepID=UPI0019518347